jgi:dihydrolipoamide dehydrogenase
MNYQVVVIGSGPGGYVAAIRAAQLGFRTACIEKDASLGGTCLNVGCIPSKTLLQSTEEYQRLLQHGKSLGIEYKELSYNLSRMMQRKEQVVKSLTDGVAMLFKGRQIDRIEGSGRLTGPHTIEVTNGTNKQLIEAENIILATGSEPIALPFLPFDEKRVLSSTGALNLSSVPKKMVVIGGGVIGVELASVYSRLGSEVTVVEMLSQICPMMDEAVSRSLLQLLKKQGIAFHLSTQVTKGEVVREGVAITIKEQETTSQLKGDLVLVGVGRRPYSTGLGLKEVGIETNPKGFVTVDGQFRTSLPNVYAIGDLIDGAMLAHRASAEGMAVAEIIAGQAPHVNYMAVPNVIYTHPEVAAVGLTEKEAREAGFTLLVGTSYMRGNPRGRCIEEEEGFVKVIGDKVTGRLLGMHIVSAHASEMIGEGMIAMEKQATLQELADAPNAHPTLSEAIKEACQTLRRAIHG